MKYMYSLTFVAESERRRSPHLKWPPTSHHLGDDAQAARDFADTLEKEVEKVIRPQFAMVSPHFWRI